MSGSEEITRNLLLQAGFVAGVDGKLTMPDVPRRSSLRSFKIDVGLSENAPEAKQWIERDFGHVFVLGFEPATRNLTKLNQGLSDKPIALPKEWIGTQILIVPCALGSTCEFKTFYALAEGGMSSLKRPRRVFIATQAIRIAVKSSVKNVLHSRPRQALRDLRVPIHYLRNLQMTEENTYVSTLDEIMSLLSEVDFPYVTHLKIDAQGSDIEVLKGGNRSLARILAVTVEAETRQYLESDGNSQRSIDEYMRVSGFTPLSEFQRLPDSQRIIAEVVDSTFINVHLWHSLGSPSVWIHQTS